MRSENNKNYEIVSMFVSTLIGCLSGVLYFETTDKAQAYEKASGIGANLIINIFVTKGSIDYLAELINKKEYKKAATVVILAAGLYTPQVLISILDSPFSAGFTMFAAISTALAGVGLYAYAVTQLSLAYEQLKDFKLTSALLPQLLITAPLVYGSMGYECATEESLRTDFHASRIAAGIAANILMLPQYALNVKGGFNLVSSVAENKKCSPAKLFFPLSAAVISSFSGVTSRNLFAQNCDSSVLSLLTFQYAATIVDYAARGFNAIFVAMALSWFADYFAKHLCGANSSASVEESDTITDIPHIVVVSDEPVRTEETRLLAPGA